MEIRRVPEGSLNVKNGIAAEYLVVSELLDRGHSVAIPVHDEGVDLVVNYSAKVQIKSSGPRSSGASFVWRILNLRGVDLVVLVGRRPGAVTRYWVVPIGAFSEFADREAISIPTNYDAPTRRPRRFTSLYEYENRWDLFEDDALKGLKS